MTLDGHLSLAPLKREPEHVLDLGTGTGVWAMDYGNVTIQFKPIPSFTK
jgi:ubiquinone/menaquinone biosynthesis C-methylase UbiE